MGKRWQERPKWAEITLQGLAFWIGHRHSLYPHYPLPEGALVAEACNLIQANLGSDQMLLCERTYRTLLPHPSPSQILSSQMRADLTIATLGARQKDRADNVSKHVRYIIEVKRGNSTWTEIQQDLKRLFEARRLSSAQVRCFLFVICERYRRPELITKEGQSDLAEQAINGVNGLFKVRRTCKAAASFGNRETAHYACLVEVAVK